jgi:uncharacterized FAD-dependent dehydrogenase
MSNYKRNSPFANAAIVISIDHEKHFGKDIFGKFVRMATSQNWYNPAGNESKVYSCGMRAVMPNETMKLYLKK